MAIKERTKLTKSTGIAHNFSDKVFCLECNHYMRKKNSAKHKYLVCSNNCDEYDNYINKSSIRYDTLENIILNEINFYKYKEESLKIYQKLINKYQN